MGFDLTQKRLQLSVSSFSIRNMFSKIYIMKNAEKVQFSVGYLFHETILYNYFFRNTAGILLIYS